MSEYYEGTTEEAEADGEVNKLEAALNVAVGKYFERHKDKQGRDITFDVVELYAIGSHNPIHGFRVVVRGEP
jgi:hypothetical protein